MDINHAVARNIRMIREKKKLTLDAAAGATGVSRSMLVQIEKGEANPTISMLWKIASGYKVSFTSLIDTTQDAATLIRADAKNSIVEDEGRFVNYPVFVFDEQRSFEIYRIVIAPGGSLQAEPHMAGTEEYITAFGGSVEITVGGETYCLNGGDSIRFKADEAHSYKNAGSHTVELSMLIYYGG